jgi:AcrR family transcriptional regulator
MPYRLTERGLERREAMRARIMTSASALFAIQGYQATTLRQVVERAGTSIGNCYFYFVNKEALLSALVADTSAKIGAMIDEAVAELPPGPGALAISVYLGVTYALENPAIGRLLFVEAPQASPRTVALDYYVERARRIFAAQPGLGGTPDVNLLAHAWQGVVFHVLEAATTGGVKSPPAEVGRYLARWNLQALGLPRATVRGALQQLERFIESRPLMEAESA